MSKKYELTDEIMEYNGVTLHRIRALKEFQISYPVHPIIVHKGQLGGWVESECNLSQTDNSWIFNEAIVTGNAFVRDNALIYDFAIISGNATIRGNAVVKSLAHVFGDALITGDAVVAGNCQIFGNACVCENSRIRGSAHVFGDASISGHATIDDNTWIYRNAHITDHSNISGNAVVIGSIIRSEVEITENAIIGEDAFIDMPCIIEKDAFITSNDDYLIIGPIGSRDDYTTFYKSKDNGIMVSCGCFNDTIAAFKEAVVNTHGKNPEYFEPYLIAIVLAKKMLS